MHPISRHLVKLTNQAKQDGIGEITIKIMLKEYLQTQILLAIYESKLGKNLIFYGGTALRKLFDLARMSEDLDFETHSKIDLQKVVKIVEAHFKKIKYEKVDYKIQAGKLIGRVTFKFTILNEVGLSPIGSEKLHVKVEISQTKYKFRTELSPFEKNQSVVMIRHYNLPILMAGKISACLTRIFKKGKTDIQIKGRDFYDLIWYMQNKVIPDKKYLQKQGFSADESFLKMDKKVNQITSQDLIADLEPYFVSKTFIKDWCDNFHQLYKRYREFYQ